MTSPLQRDAAGWAERVRDRKAEHLELAQQSRMQMGGQHFDDWQLPHCALPELDFDEIDTSVVFLGRRLQAPLLISCMTGGTAEARRINRNLARAAEAAGVAMGVGSQRAALEDPSLAETFCVRDLAPDVPLLANLGAVQLNYGFGPDECRRAVEMLDADALVLHVNALQEAIQPEGQRNFAGLLHKIARVVEALDVPVIVKEVGCGISAEVARRLLEAGVRIIDVAGSGGTSWARIEGVRAEDPDLGDLFADWGIPTPVAILRLREIEGLTVIGSGGVRTGVDVAKAIAAGAHLAGLAQSFLMVAAESAARVLERSARVVKELKVCMFCTGARDLEALRRVPLVHRSRWQT